MKKFKWSEIKKPVFVLAPMANITTLPFRSICKEFGADIVFTPMLSSNAVIHNPAETLKIAEFLPQEQPVIVQIFGYSPELMAKAATIIDDKLKPAGIDINFGCPAPKITGNECGSALLKNFPKALEIVKAVREAYKGQLSVKLRLGWYKYEIEEFARELEKIGIDAISIHGRTTKQGYSGKADWEPIYKIAESLSIPVIGNGDVDSYEIAQMHLDNSKIKGVMVGRPSLNRPWLFKELKTGDRVNDSKELIKETLLKQTKLNIEYTGSEEQGVREMRKFYGWYIKGFPGASELRREAVQASTLDEIKSVIDRI